MDTKQLNTRHYGYIGKGDDNCNVTKPLAQQMSGIPIGIVLLIIIIVLNFLSKLVTKKLLSKKGA